MLETWQNCAAIQARLCFRCSHMRKLLNYNVRVISAEEILELDLAMI